MDRGVLINIENQEYTMVLTTRATKEINRDMGGLRAIGELLKKGDSTEQIEVLCKMIALLCNQGTLIAKLEDSACKKKLLTGEAVELLTSPADFEMLEEAVLECIIKGTKREVQSEQSLGDNEKNVVNG